MSDIKIGMCTLDWSQMLGTGNPCPKDLPTPGGAAWYRIALPAMTLAANGVDCVYGPHLTGQGDEFHLRMWDESLIDDCDVMVVQRWMGRLGPEFTKRAVAAGQVVINDVDDWLEGIPPSNIGFWGQHPRMNQESNREFYRGTLAASSALTVSTPYLRERYHKMFPKMPIFVIPNALDVSRWPVQNVSRRCKLGWVGATFNRSSDLEVLTGVLGDWLLQHKVPFFHGGANTFRDESSHQLGLPKDVRYASLPMASIEDYPSFFRQFTAGVVPLSGHPFNLAKSNIKGLEMSAAGIPFVATPTPAYEELYARGAGRTADNPKRWRRELDRLLDADFRVEQGIRNRAVVEQHYDMANNWRSWLDVYEELTR